MKNVTITLPDELAQKAKVFAAEQNTSVSRYVGKLLSERLEQEQGYRDAMNQWCSVEPSILNEDGAKYPTREELHER
jgi:predicted transcriptional regulator